MNKQTKCHSGGRPIRVEKDIRHFERVESCRVFQKVVERLISSSTTTIEHTQASATMHPFIRTESPDQDVFSRLRISKSAFCSLHVRYISGGSTVTSTRGLTVTQPSRFAAGRRYLGLSADSFEAVDSHAISAPNSAKTSLDYLARYLMQAKTGDRDLYKLRVMFRWICNNITHEGETTLQSTDPHKVLATGLLLLPPVIRPWW